MQGGEPDRGLYVRGALCPDDCQRRTGGGVIRAIPSIATHTVWVGHHAVAVELLNER